MEEATAVAAPEEGAEAEGAAPVVAVAQVAGAATKEASS